MTNLEIKSKIEEWLEDKNNFEIFEKMQGEIANFLGARYRSFPIYMHFYALETLLQFTVETRNTVLNIMKD